MTNIYKSSLALAIFFTLTACGGGSGSSDSTPKEPENAAPVISPIETSSVVEMNSIDISAQANDSNGQISTYLWEQVSGSSVQLTNIETSTVSIETNNISEDETAQFKITVTDDKGATTSRNVSLSVIDRPDISVEDISIVEGDNGLTEAVLTVSLSKSWYSNVNFEYQTKNSTAISGDDYQEISGTGTIVTGETTATINAYVIGDTQYSDIDSVEAFLLQITNITNADNETATGTITIENDDMSKVEAYDDLKTQVVTLRNSINEELEPIRTNDDSNIEYFIDIKYTNIDLNNDGDTDVLYTSSESLDHIKHTQSNHNIYIFRNNVGKGFSLEKLAAKSNGVEFEIADFNQDGLDDVYIAESGYDLPPHPGHQDILLLQTANGGLEDVSSSSLVQILDYSHGACNADFNGDNVNEVFIAKGGSIKYLINDGQGGFSIDNEDKLPMEVLSFQYLQDNNLLTPDLPWNDYAHLFQISHWNCQTLDFDMDGDKDLLLGGTYNANVDITNYYGDNVNSKHLILENDGAGNFSYSKDNLVPFNVHSSSNPDTVPVSLRLPIMDFNKDSCPDIATMSTNYQLSSFNFYINDCKGNYELINTQLNDQNYGNGMVDVLSDNQVVFTPWVVGNDILSFEYIDGQIEQKTLVQSDWYDLSPAVFLFIQR